MGGEEDIRRASHESFRSRSSFTIEAAETVRKSVDRVRSIGKPKSPYSPRKSPRRQNTRASFASSHREREEQVATVS
jgi:hypothetical protein